MNNVLGGRQYEYARTEIKNAKVALDEAIRKSNNFNTENSILDGESEIRSTSNYVTALEASLVELKVEEGRLKRTFTDENAPEIQAIRDQIQELTSQIDAERKRIVDIRGRNLGGKASESAKLKQEVVFAEKLLESAKLSAETNRMKSIQQVKLLVLLSDPENPQTQHWAWRYKLAATSLLSILLINGTFKFFSGLKGKR